MAPLNAMPPTHLISSPVRYDGGETDRWLVRWRNPTYTRRFFFTFLSGTTYWDVFNIKN
ncbi:hypothetical protein HanXRQr2_Chr01g0028251 [Helianthus annuus]|uniref:Uncharacterized protein n=1 Tax=Helianthus annuus TaxID=4232 RepID=A0A251VR59_HELAN|nr:hypothetical protein HanXRQr2_Chr01g0028251 [Helianthus annuus]